MKSLAPLVFVFTLTFCFSCGEDKPKKTYTPPKKEINTKSTASAAKEEAEAAEEVPPSDPVPPEQLAKAKEIINAVDADAVAAVDAKGKFKMLCAACHGFKGDMGVNGAKNLKKSKISLEESVAQVYFGKGLMTPFKGLMEDAEIVAVAKYIETLR